MPSRKKKPYEKKRFESTGTSSDTSANIYMSMLLSPAWLELTANQQRLYLYCKAQYYAEKNKHNSDPITFTMNRSKWCLLYKLYSDTNRDGFYRDRDALIERGFIRVVVGGQNTRTKTIYAFWDMWQKWGRSDFIVSPQDMSSSMLRKLQKDKAASPD